MRLTNTAGNGAEGLIQQSGSVATQPLQLGWGAFGSAPTDFAISIAEGGVGFYTVNPSSSILVSSHPIVVDGTGGYISVPGSSITANAFFGDGSGLSGVGGGVSLAANNTWTGVNTFAAVAQASATYTTPGGFVSAGGPSQANSLNKGRGIWATSTDGAVQSSGCVVSVLFADGGDTTAPTFTSTTTNNSHLNGYRAGVLLETCSPGMKCRVGIGPGQPYRIRADASGIAEAAGWLFSATRCMAGSQAAVNDNLHGYKMQSAAVAASAFFWAVLRE